MSAEPLVLHSVETGIHGEKIFPFSSTPQAHGENRVEASLQEMVTGSAQEIIHDDLQRRLISVMESLNYNSLYQQEGATPQLMTVEQHMLLDGGTISRVPSHQFSTVGERENRTTPTKSLFNLNSGLVEYNIRNGGTSNPTINPGSTKTASCTRKCVVCLEKGESTQAIFNSKKGASKDKLKEKSAQLKKRYRDLLARLDIRISVENEKPEDLGICATCLSILQRWNAFNCAIKKRHEEEEARRTLEISGWNSANGKKTNLECQICHKILMTHGGLKGHMKRHEGIGNHKCEVCSKGFYYKASLAAHKIAHETSSKFICGLCGKGFKQKWGINKHITIHTKEKPFGCPICHRMFRLKNYVNAHMKVHKKSGELKIGSGQGIIGVLNNKGDTFKPLSKRKPKKSAPKKEVPQGSGSDTSAQEQTVSNSGSTDGEGRFKTYVLLDPTRKVQIVNPPEVHIPIMVRIKDEPTE